MLRLVICQRPVPSLRRRRKLNATTRLSFFRSTHRTRSQRSQSGQDATKIRDVSSNKTGLKLATGPRIKIRDVILTKRRAKPAHYEKAKTSQAKSTFQPPRNENTRRYRNVASETSLTETYLVVIGH